MMAKHSSVMIVDDNEEYAKALGVIFEEKGFEVIIYHDGVEAVRNYRRILPDIIIMDKKMPLKNGAEATEEILKIDPDAVIMGITGFEDDGSFVKSGVKEVYKKPIDTTRLFADVEQYINNVSMNIFRQRMTQQEKMTGTILQKVIDLECGQEEMRYEIASVTEHTKSIISIFKSEMTKVRNVSILGGTVGSIASGTLSYLNSQEQISSVFIKWLATNPFFVILGVILGLFAVVYFPKIFKRKQEEEEPKMKLPQYLWQVNDAFTTHKRKQEKRKEMKQRLL